jgi:hypothetical protein
VHEGHRQRQLVKFWNFLLQLYETTRSTTPNTRERLEPAFWCRKPIPVSRDGFCRPIYSFLNINDIKWRQYLQTQFYLKDFTGIVVSKLTSYELDNQASISPARGEIFLITTAYRLAPEPTQSPILRKPGFHTLPRLSGRILKLTAHLYIERRLTHRGGLPPCPTCLLQCGDAQADRHTFCLPLLWIIINIIQA